MYVKKGLNLWPLFRYEDDPFLERRKVEVLWPFFVWERSPNEHHLQVIPFWVQHRSLTRSYRVAFPLFWQGHSTEGLRQRSHLYVLPLFYQWGRDEPEIRGRTTLCLPLFRFEQDLKHGGFYFLSPLGVWAVKRRHGQFVGALGSVLWLYWHSSDPESVSNVLFPLAWHASNAQRRYFILPPLLFADVVGKRTGKRLVMVFPLYVFYRPPFDAPDTDPTHWVLWPLFWFKVRRTPAGLRPAFYP